MVPHTCNPSTLELEAAGLEVQSQTRLLGGTSDLSAWEMRQDNQGFKVILGYIVNFKASLGSGRPSLKKKNKQIPTTLASATGGTCNSHASQAPALLLCPEHVLHSTRTLILKGLIPMSRLCYMHIDLQMRKARAGV